MKLKKFGMAMSNLAWFHVKIKTTLVILQK